MKQKSRKGFTLVELIVIIGLIGIVSAMGTSHFMGVLEANQQAAIRADAERLAGALNAFNGVAIASPAVYPGDSRIVSISDGAEPHQGMGGANHWGGTGAFASTRGMRDSHGWGAAAEARTVLCWLTVWCIFDGGACTEGSHIVQLTHYVNVWNPLVSYPAGTNGAFESTGVMSADFSLSIDCDSLIAILNPAVGSPLIEYVGERWRVVEP